MNILKIILSALFVLSCSTISRADSVVISFEGGKTQTIPLYGPIKSITAVQYLPSGDQSTAAPVSPEPQADNATSTPPHEAKQPQQPPKSQKGNVKFKWADPLVSE